MKKYKGIDDLKSSINTDMCVGCSICAQVCPVNAIKQVKEGKDE
jgi:indolepyruvate ferredoxin oxidoreductase alpha subunit